MSDKKPLYKQIMDKLKERIKKELMGAKVGRF